MTWLLVFGVLALSSDSASMSICGAEKSRVGECSMIMSFRGFSPILVIFPSLTLNAFANPARTSSEILIEGKIGEDGKRINTCVTFSLLFASMISVDDKRMAAEVSIPVCVLNLNSEWP
jgi:hypothetical protein